MKKPPGGKIIHSGQKHLPSWADPGVGGQEKFVVKPRVYLFHAEMLNVPRLHAERVVFFCTSCHAGVPT